MLLNTGQCLNWVAILCLPNSVEVGLLWSVTFDSYHHWIGQHRKKWGEIDITLMQTQQWCHCTGVTLCSIKTCCPKVISFLCLYQKIQSDVREALINLFLTSPPQTPATCQHWTSSFPRRRHRGRYHTSGVKKEPLRGIKARQSLGIQILFTAFAAFPLLKVFLKKMPTSGRRSTEL